MEYTGKDRRSQTNTAMRILIDGVKTLQTDKTRNSALTVSNGVKIDGILVFNKKCDSRMTKVELWRERHVGQGEGKEKLSDRLGAKITLYSVVGTLIIAGLAFYFAELKPKLDMSLGVVNKITAIEQKYQELLKP